MSGAAEAASLRAGFGDPVRDAQATFRLVLEAMARPGRVQEIAATLDPPPGVHPASAAILLTLLDHETPVWIELASGRDEAARFFAFHCGCPLAEAPEEARFVLVDALPQAMERFPAGSAERPELSATLILQLKALDGGTPVALSGPGIEERARIAPRGLPAAFWDMTRDNHALFPSGVDFILVAGRAICGLPRTTRAEA
ncbi:MAG: phosphonate C-P lyase system protein PhnH [Alphaproteobacteria bacterium]